HMSGRIWLAIISPFSRISRASSCSAQISATLRFPTNKDMADGPKTSDPCVMVIFGATGDLMKRKLLPALYNLAKDDFLPHKFAVIGVGRQEMSSEEFRKMVIDEL